MTASHRLTPLTDSVIVTPEPHYLADRSSPDTDEYVFAYTITIENRSPVPVQLISRHWIITDGNESIEEVRGQGVVGEQPLLQPGAAYTYTSGCVLNTPVGTMRGTYQMVSADGERFDATIPEFALAVPARLH